MAPRHRSTRARRYTLELLPEPRIPEPRPPVDVLLRVVAGLHAL